MGKNVDQEKSNIKLEQGTKETRQEAENISNDVAYKADEIKNITQNIPMEYMLLMIFMAGWAIPDYGKTYRGIKIVSSDVFNAVIKDPLKGIGGFILKLRRG